MTRLKILVNQVKTDSVKIQLKNYPLTFMNAAFSDFPESWLALAGVAGVGG